LIGWRIYLTTWRYEMRLNPLAVIAWWVAYREQRDQNGRGHAFTRQYRIGFRQNMASRRTQRYLGA
jgi:hypothetical protein